MINVNSWKTSFSFLYSELTLWKLLLNSQREKFPNTEFFLVRIFLYSDWIYSVNLRIQSEYRKKGTRKNSIFERFSRSE